MSLRAKAVSGIKWTTISLFGRVGFQLAQISILTRFLPKEDFGLVAMALFVVQFSNIFVDMGMNTAILNKQDISKKQYSSIYWLSIFAAAILYGLMFSSASFVSRFYNQPELNQIIPILGLNVIIVAIGRQHYTIMRKNMRFKSIAFIELISIPLGLVVSVTLAISGFGVYSLVFSTLIVSLISNLLFLVNNLRENPIMLYFRMSDTRPFLNIAGYTMGSTLLDFFSREIDVLIIGKMLGAESLGIYSLAKQMVTRLYSVVNPVVLNVLTPIMSSMQMEKERIKFSYLKVIRYLANINFPTYLLFVVCSREIIHVFYGADYTDSYMVLSYLAIAYCLVTISNPVGSLQVATGRTDLGFKWTIFRVLVSPISLYLGGLYNIEVVAGSYALLSLLLIVPMWLVQLKPMINLKLQEYVNQFYRPFLMFFVCILLTTVFSQLIGPVKSVLISGIVKGLFAVSVYSLLSYYFDRVNSKEVLTLVFSIIKRKY